MSKFTTKSFIIGLDKDTRKLVSYKKVEDAVAFSEKYQLIEANTAHEAKEIWWEIYAENQNEEL